MPGRADPQGGRPTRASQLHRPRASVPGRVSGSIFWQSGCHCPCTVGQPLAWHESRSGCLPSRTRSSTPWRKPPAGLGRNTRPIGARFPSRPRSPPFSASLLEPRRGLERYGLIGDGAGCGAVPLLPPEVVLLFSPLAEQVPSLSGDYVLMALVVSRLSGGSRDTSVPTALGLMPAFPAIAKARER
jgi:hypothetical protein